MAIHRESEAGPEERLEGTGRGKRLGELLVERNDVSAADIEKTLRIQESVGGRLGALLVRTGAISEDLLMRRLAEQQGARYLRGADDLPDSLEVYQFLSESSIKLDWFLDNAVLIWRREEELFCIARDIQDHALLATLEYFYPGEPVTWCLAANHQIDRLLDFVRKERAIENLYSGDGAKQLREMAEEAPNHRAGQQPALPGGGRERLRRPRRAQRGPLHGADAGRRGAAHPPHPAGGAFPRRRLPHQAHLGDRHRGAPPAPGRAHLHPHLGTGDGHPRVHRARAFGESIVLRMLAKERDELVLDNLGMEADHLALFRSWFQASNGIVLVTGPTGSGKSTTLAAALQEIDDGIKKIITVEDPVEHQMPSITQIQTHAEIGFTFARALRAILRQDPDVIMIGEIRDLETAEIAIRSAMTGHIVLSTVHTNDALSSFTRLIDMGVEPFLVAAPVRGVQAQRLVRRACGRCAQPAAPPSRVREQLALLPPELVGERFVEGPGLRGMPPHRLPRPHRHLRAGAGVGRAAGPDRLRRAARRSQEHGARAGPPHPHAGRPDQGIPRTHHARGGDAPHSRGVSAAPERRCRSSSTRSSSPTAGS